jgi:hypothetical protein
MFLVFIILFPCESFALKPFSSPSDFAKKLCREEPKVYKCIKIKISRRAKIQYKEWAELFPDLGLRFAEMEINRRNTLLWNGHTIAVFRNFSHNLLDYSPFSREREGMGSRFIVVDLNKLAWAAYESIPNKTNAYLVSWGVANGGSKICPETGKLECKTHPGLNYILRMYGKDKRSELYPITCVDKKICGHQMPFFMPFHIDGTGLHCNKWLVGRNSSHGCVRMFCQDAEWINKNFAFVGMPVLVEDY